MVYPSRRPCQQEPASVLAWSDRWLLGTWHASRTMNVMQPSLVTAAKLGLMSLLLAGCANGEAKPTKRVRSPEGGAPVLKTEQRATQQNEVGAPSNITRASFEQPVEEPQVLKPFEQ